MPCREPRARTRAPGGSVTSAPSSGIHRNAQDQATPDRPLLNTRFYGDSSVKPSGWSTLMDCWSREFELDLAGAFNGIKEEV